MKMALVTLPKECLVCLNSTETVFVPTEESQEIFSVCFTYVKDAINMNLLINSIIDNNSKLSFCKNCLDLSSNLSQLVEQRSKLKQEIKDLSTRFSEAIAKQRIQVTVNIRKNKNNRTTQFQVTNNQKANLDCSGFVGRLVSNTFSSDFNQDSFMTSECSTNKLRTEENDTDDEIAIIPIVKTESDDNLQEIEDETCIDIVSSDREDEYKTNNLVPKDENNDDDYGELDLEPTLRITNNSDVINELKPQCGTPKSVVSVGMPNIVLKRISLSDDVTTKNLDTFNSTDISHQDKSGVDINETLPGSSAPKRNSLTTSDKVKSKPKKRRRRHACTICQKSFNSTTDVKRHSASHTAEKPHKCTICGKSYKLYRDLQIHKRLHTGERPYQCSFCESAFVRLNDLKDHEANHTNERPYKCSQCTKSFMRPSHLKNHERTNHNEENPYKCSHCKSSFLRQLDLKSHVKIHTTTISTQNSKQLYICSYCKGEFDSPQDLKDHVTLHTGETPYKCKYCETSFTNKGARRRHQMKFHPDMQTH